MKKISTCIIIAIILFFLGNLLFFNIILNGQEIITNLVNPNNGNPFFVSEQLITACTYTLCVIALTLISFSVIIFTILFYNWFKHEKQDYQ